MTKEELKAFNDIYVQTSINTLNQIKEIARAKCVETLKEIGGSAEWDWEEGDAPSLTSIYFQDDITDCYITKAYLDEYGNIKVNLHAYYLGNDVEDVFLSYEPNADYLDLLEYLNHKL